MRGGGGGGGRSSGGGGGGEAVVEEDLSCYQSIVGDSQVPQEKVVEAFQQLFVKGLEKRLSWTGAISLVPIR